MKKQTFFQLEDTHEILTSEQAKEIIGGGGIITSGNGSASNPYIITTNFYCSEATTLTYASGGVALLNGMGTFGSGGVYYQNNATLTDMTSDANAAADIATHLSNDQQGGMSYGQVIKSGSLGQDDNGNELFGQTNPYDGTITLDVAKMHTSFVSHSLATNVGTTYTLNGAGSGGSNLQVTMQGEAGIMSGVAFHEMGHVLGAQEDTGYAGGYGLMGSLRAVYNGTSLTGYVKDTTVTDRDDANFISDVQDHWSGNNGLGIYKVDY